jgi:creatinine amidohydrolase
VKPETLKAILFDTIECLKQWGFTDVFCVNLHGDPQHQSVIRSSIRDIREVLEIEVYDLSTLSVNLPRPSSSPARTGKFSPDYHAGANETALIWTYYPKKSMPNGQKP